MYPPEEKGEIVKTTEGIGEWTGETEFMGEHFKIRHFRYPKDKKVFLHYEDIEEIGKELKEKLKEGLGLGKARKKLEEVV